ncbi:GntR family transcriptional regulator [Sphingosinicella terrae]|uniref:GntR family transcriptional regulator n=1 Tax=Sphingosinicella terrae TaxID=2172047 RepID=UPI000E0DD6E6|nr:FCD domain-containing protein [Sphingosinicella terrae]
MMELREPDETLVDAVQARLRSDIINSVLPAGTRLRIDLLRKRYATGATPLREALSRLLVEGLVELSNGRGFRVPPLSYEDLWDISRTRALVEGAAAREAAERADEAWEASLVSAFHLLRRRAERNLADRAHRQAYYDAHHRFHEALLAGCESPRLMEMQVRLERQHSRYYRQLPFERITGDDLIGEHQRLLDLALGHDGAALEQTIRSHVMLTVGALGPERFSAAFAA